MRRAALLASLLAFLAPCVHSQAKRPFTFEDMMALKRVEEPCVSPDGKWVVFGVVDVNLAENTKTPHIWIVPLAGGAERQLTSGKEGENRPRFSPDGKQIAFTSSKGGSQQIWLVGFDAATGTLSGDPRKLTNISTEADGEIWSPDGKNIVFVSRVYPDCPDDACNKQRDEEKSKSKVQAKIFTKLFYRHWNAYTDYKRSHLFVIPVLPGERTASAGSRAPDARAQQPAAGVAEPSSKDGGVAQDLTPGDYDVPPFSLGGPDDYDISPDSKEVAYTSNQDPVEAISTNNDIFLVPISGGESKKVSTSPGSDSTPRYSPDGKYIAWRMQKRNGYESDRFRLVTYDHKSGEIANLTEDFDRWVGAYVWRPDSKWLYFSVEEAGAAPIYTISLDGKLFQVTSGSNDDLAITADGHWLVFTNVSVHAPTAIAKSATTTPTRCRIATGPEFIGGKGMSCEWSIQKPEVITNLNNGVLDQVSMPPLDSFWFHGAGGDKVQGFLVKPPNFDASKKYPLKFIVHGGPQVPMGDLWSYRWNAELFAASGYVVVMINFHGSPGYGQKFIDAINGDWGGAPFQDLMLGLDYVEKAYPFVDKDRECALGASYGGYMIDWILGHTNRFKCLVSHDGMADAEAAYGQTEELWFNEWEFKGMPWTNREMYRKWSPILSAPNFKTPTLVVHGQKDYRLDVSQGFELFTTLQRLKVPSKMLYFPDEGHWVLKPQNSQLWYQTGNDWVDSYLKK